MIINNKIIQENVSEIVVVCCTLPQSTPKRCRRWVMVSEISSNIHNFTVCCAIYGTVQQNVCLSSKGSSLESPTDINRKNRNSNAINAMLRVIKCT